MGQSPAVVVFDFDLTLTRWDTSERFFKWLLKRQPWRLALVGLALPVLLPLLLLRSTRKWPVRFAVWVATQGRTNADLPALAETHIRSLPEGPLSVFLPVALAQMRKHLEGGDRVVIATGCVEALAQVLLRHAGLGEVPLVASTLRPYLGGLVREQHCFGANKVPMLAGRGFAPPWKAAYTDHHADLPILRLSSARFLVSPSLRCRVRIERELGPPSAVFSWRS
jgi:phosphatidylglycerophosphatase C